ncbi:uncharacterized protein LOC134201065 [Bombyx mori]|uniref:uncharacterized protein LOC134201065 n=1 Tax=Bombyx mori TaxID=7091 RepID=UPI002ECFDFD2
MVESQEVLSHLIGKRRYVKGSLTRLYNQLGETERLSTETIQCRLERCVVAFREYGDYCGRILATNPADEEDSGSSFKEALRLLDQRYYNKYNIMTELLSTLLDLDVISKPSPSNIRHFVSTIKQTLAALKNMEAKVDEWDPILMLILTRKLDERTAREYQLDRDNTMDPTVDQLLAFLEKRALAMENAGQSAAKLFTTKVVNAVTAKEKRGCSIYVVDCIIRMGKELVK